MKVRNCSIKSTITAMLGGAFLCIALFSCKNFLNAGTVSKEIKDVIAYNNAKTVNVLIECKEDMGTIFPQQSYPAKLGYAFEIQFIPNTENYIIKNPDQILQAVNRIDRDQSRADCVEFKVVEQSFEDKKAGLYRIEVKVVKYADDILVLPDCLPCPAIKSTSPEHSSTGHYANTPIIITFNVPIENDNGNEGVFKYSEDNISIISSEGDMSNYFDKPVLSSDNTRLNLIPKAKELSNYISNKNLEYLDLKISFSPKISIIQSGVKLSFVQNEHSDFTVRYMEKMEKTAPVLVANTFFATRHSLSLSDAQTFPADKKCLIKTLENFESDAEYLQNRIRNEIYICGKYFDAESGVQYIKVSAQLTNDYKGDDKSVVPASYEFFVSEGNNSEFIRDDEGYVSFCAKIDNLDVFENGAVKVTVKALDYCNNVSEVQTFTVFKKSFGDEVFDNIEVGNAYEWENAFSSQYSSLEFTKEEYNDFLKTIYIEENYTQLLCYKNGHYTLIPKQNYTFKCNYREKNGNTGEFLFDPEVGIYGSLKATKKLEVQSISGLSFAITISDDIGNIGTRDFKIPDSDKISVALCTGGGSYKCKAEIIYFYSENEEIIPLSFPCLWISENQETHKFIFESKEPECDLIAGEYNYIAHWGDSCYKGDMKKRNAQFFSAVSENKQTLTIVNTTQKNIASSASIQPLEDDGWLNVTVTVNPDQGFNNYYLSYPVVNKESDSETGIWNNCYFEPGQLSCSFKTSTKYYLKKQLEFYLYGTQDGIRYNTKFSYKNNSSINLANDNYAPRYEIRRDKYTYYNFVATDVGSGIKNGTVTVNRTGHKFDFSDDGSGYYYCAYVPIQEFLLGNNSVSVNIKDNQDNSLEKQDNIYLDYDPLTFETAEKTTDGWKITTGVDSGVHYTGAISFQWSLLNASNTTPEWSEIRSYLIGAVNTNPDNSYRMNANITFSDYGYNNANEYSFLKIMTVPITGNLTNNYTYKFGGAPMYIYAGSADPNGFFDYILPNTNKSVLVMSDGPTYIHAVSTPTDYYECKDWSIAQWETYNHTFGDVYWSGSSTAPRNYKIDMDEILPGESYCVIAYFAKGKPAKSAVMVKP